MASITGGVSVNNTPELEAIIELLRTLNDDSASEREENAEILEAIKEITNR